MKNENIFDGLEIRVGKIVDVWKHPESEKLYCEKIAFLEDFSSNEGLYVKEIASGLQHFYTLEEIGEILTN